MQNGKHEGCLVQYVKIRNKNVGPPVQGLRELRFQAFGELQLLGPKTLKASFYAFHAKCFAQHVSELRELYPAMSVDGEVK